MLDKRQLLQLKQVAQAIAGQFGKSCEVVIHDITGKRKSSIVHIENGHVSGRKLGDGPSHVVLEQMVQNKANPQDHIGYLTKTPDGKVLKSSSVYIKDDNGSVCAIFSINFDISVLSALTDSLSDLVRPVDETQTEPEKIPQNVGDLLDDLIAQADALVGKPAALMTKEEKIRAIRFLNERGALLITKSGDKISQHFGISKYTLYSYLESGKQEEN